MSTESKIYWSVGIVSILIFAGSFLIPADASRKDDVPWHIEHPSAGSVRVFGLTLGEASTNEAEQRFKEEAKPSLFKSPDGELIAEMFFEQVKLSGLHSRIVLTVDVPKSELKEMYERGLRMASTGSGKKITLTPEDIERVRTLPVNSLTYMPGLRVDDTVFLKRFGEPEQRIRETKSGAVHWLYPQNGLDITLGGSEKPLLQFVAPRDFDRLSKPLLAYGEAVN
ncbi:MAG: hypothetical protein V1879_04420 [Pseudomonadota bacterium]